jgi:general secretion pathway protein J
MSRAREEGFTLIELLVSMTLLGFVFVILFGGLRFGSRAWEKSDSETDATDTVRLVQALLRSEIERACPRRVPAADSTAAPRVQFTGAADGLSFLAPAPAASGVTGCARLALAVLPDGRQERLVLRIGTDEPSSAPLETDLVRHAQRIELAYLANGAGWRSGWSDESDLPALVRVRVAFPDGDARVWPELYATPEISAEADCTYDPNSKSCQVR